VTIGQGRFLTNGVPVTTPLTLREGTSCGGAYCNLRCRQFVTRNFNKEYPQSIREEMGDIAAETFERFKRTVDSDTEPGDELQPDMLVQWDTDLMKKMSEYNRNGLGWSYISDRITIERSVNSSVIPDATS
jgi:hypothetical protein